MSWRNSKYEDLVIILDTQCRCNTRDYKTFIDKDYGHVITLDSRICKNSHLQYLLSLGANFRPAIIVDTTKLLNEIKQAFTKIVEVWSRKYTIQIRELYEWKGLCTNDIGIQLQRLISNIPGPTVWEEADDQSLVELQKDLVITYVDKAPNNFAYICKKHYIQRLINEFKAPTYLECKETANELINWHYQASTKYALRYNADMYNRLAYAYTSHKATKVTAEVRYIAGSYMCSLQPLSILINTLLNTLRPSLCALWDTLIYDKTLEPVSIWMIQNSKKVVERIKLFNRTLDFKAKTAVTMETYDVKTLYTNIPHDDLILKLELLFKEIEINSNTEIGFRMKGKTCTLVEGNIIETGKQKGDAIYNMKDLLNMIRFLVNNTHITIADKIFRQCIGIPMGTNAGVNIVDFYLVKYELDFMKQLVDKEKWELITKFEHTMRYLDDILSVDNEFFENYLYNDVTLDGIHGIYPSNAVKLQKVEKGSRINYMDVTIVRFEGKHKVFANKLYTQCYDKRRHGKLAALNLIKYPSASSLLSQAVGHNIIITQCHRYAILDMYITDFIKDTVQVLGDLVRKGYSKTKLLEKIKHFLLSYKQKVLYGIAPFGIYWMIKKEVQAFKFYSSSEKQFV